VDTKAELQEAAVEFLPEPGPSFLLIKIEPDKEERHISRITHTPEQIAARFMTICQLPVVSSQFKKGEN
jgi:hypothetical protein